MKPSASRMAVLGDPVAEEPMTDAANATDVTNGTSQLVRRGSAAELTRSTES